MSFPISSIAAGRAIPAAPPSEVLDAIGVAARAYDRLQASGRQVHFDLNGDAGKLTVQVQDLERNRLGTLSFAKLLDIASGAPLD